MKSYDGFFESTSGLVPAPGACHPALMDHFRTILASTNEEFTIGHLTYPNGPDNWPALKQLHFVRGWAYGWDAWHNYWIWPVWKDQFGRAVGGEAALWTTYAT